MPTTINRKFYPELNRLQWDVHCETIDLEFALRVSACMKNAGASCKHRT